MTRKPHPPLPRARRAPGLAARAAFALAAVWIAAGAAGAGAQPLPQPDRPASQNPGLDLMDIGVDQKLNESVALDGLFREVRSVGGTAEAEIIPARPLRDFLNRRPSILFFTYERCPMLCSLARDALLRSMRAVSLNLGRDYNALAVDLDPDEDPNRAAAARSKLLAEYARPGAEEGWRSLLGDEAAIRALAASAGYRYVYDPVGRQYAHPAAWIILTPEGRVSRCIFGIDAPPRDLKLALTEASRGTIGTPVDRVLLYCYRYNSATGRYTPAVMAMVRAGGGITLAAMAGLLLLLRGKAAPRAPAHPAGQPDAAGASEHE